MTKNRHKFSSFNKVKRILWSFVYVFLFKPFKPRVFKNWRIFILRLFGAKVSWNAIVYSNAKVWAPWNLEMKDYSCLGPNVDCYNQGKITICENATVSQKVYLCASSHDYTSKSHKLFLAPITIEKNAWVAASAFIGPGVTIGEGSVVGATASVYRDVEPWEVVGGNPAKFIKRRELKD